MGLHCPRTRPLSTYSTNLTSEIPIFDSGTGHDAPFFSNYTSIAEATADFFGPGAADISHTMPGAYVSDTTEQCGSPLLTRPHLAGGSMSFSRSTSSLLVQHNRRTSASTLQEAQSHDHSRSRASSMESVVFFANSNCPSSNKASPVTSTHGTSGSSTTSDTGFGSHSQTQVQVQTCVPIQGLRRTHRIIRISSLDISITNFREDKRVDKSAQVSCPNNFMTEEHVNVSHTVSDDTVGFTTDPIKPQQVWPSQSVSTLNNARVASPQHQVFGTVRKQPVKKQVHWDFSSGINDIDEGDPMDVDEGFGLSCSKWRA